MLANYHGWNTVVEEHSPWAALMARPARVVAAAPGVEYVESNSTALIPRVISRL